MRKLKVGDEVESLRSHLGFTEGKTYKVVGVDDLCINLIDDDGDYRTRDADEFKRANGNITFREFFEAISDFKFKRFNTYKRIVDDIRALINYKGQIDTEVDQSDYLGRDFVFSLDLHLAHNENSIYIDLSYVFDNDQNIIITDVDIDVDYSYDDDDEIIANAETKKVFDKYQYLRRALEVEMPFDILKSALNIWVEDCHGKTKEEISKMGLVCNDTWMIEVEV